MTNSNMMVELGKINHLPILRVFKHGAYLGFEDENVLLPSQELSPEDRIGETISVFIYKDNHNRIIATKRIPIITIGELAMLEVKEITSIGAFMDWGLSKDLLLPFKEQTVKLEKGRKYLVALYIDKSDRLCATMRIRDYLSSESPYKVNDWVQGVVYSYNREIGAFVAVDNRYEAMIPAQEVYGAITEGETIKARVVNIKKDGKLDLTLRDRSYLMIDEDAKTILDVLERNNGFVPYNDGSNPTAIREKFQGMSKSSFKKALGHLLKEKKIEFYNDGIQLKRRNHGK